MTEDQKEANPTFSERIDLIFVRDIDRIVDYLTKNLPMNLEKFFDFFQANYSLEKTAFTVTLA